jgi:CubicO group peptidase (beta-lactamase class C family)
MLPRIVATVACAASSAGHAQSPPGFDSAPGLDGLRARWAPLLAEFEVPGMAIAVVKDGTVHAIETFGVRYPGSAEPPTPDTMYYIASITKTYVATAICAMADDGLLSLDDPVNRHLPRFDLAGTADDSITIRDLLCHRPGISCEAIVLLDAFTGEITEDRYYRWLATVAPGPGMSYQNIHYTLLGRVIEARTGKPWRDYLDERIFRPAGLTRTTGYASRMYGDPDCAIPMELVAGAWRECALRKTDRTMHAAGGLGASATDAARWLVLHVNDGEIDGNRVLSASAAREMRVLAAPFPKPSGSLRIMEGFGLGWQVGTFHGTPLCSHGGGYAGTYSYYAMLPEKRAGLVILINASGAAAGLGDVIAIDVLDRLIDGDERVDVLDAYRNRIAARKKERDERAAGPEAVPAAPALSFPLAAYAGRYLNEDLDTITVRTDGEQLVIALGDCRLDVTAADRPDACRVLGPAAEGVVLAFVAGPAGSPRPVTAVTATIPDGGGAFTFIRDP